MEMSEQAKAARNEYMRKYREANKEKFAAARKHYYETHREQVKAAQRAYYAAHKEEVKIRHAVYWDNKAVASIETPEQPSLADEVQREFMRHRETNYEAPEVPGQIVRTAIKRLELRKRLNDNENK